MIRFVVIDLNHNMERERVSGGMSLSNPITGNRLSPDGPNFHCDNAMIIIPFAVRLHYFWGKTKALIFNPEIDIHRVQQE